MGLFRSLRRVKPQGAAEVTGGKASDIKASPQAAEPGTEGVSLEDFKAEVAACNLSTDWEESELELLFKIFDRNGNKWVDQKEFSSTKEKLITLLQALDGAPAKEKHDVGIASPATLPTPSPCDGKLTEESLQLFRSARSKPTPLQRDGMWFIVPKVAIVALQLDSKPDSATCDVYSEFFSKHWNGCTAWTAFVMVQLDWNDIERLRSKLRVCPYRWGEVCQWNGDAASDQDTDTTSVPGNYGWFLSILLERGLVGWLDFTSNVAVGVPKRVTLDYMGEMYYKAVVLGQWLLDSRALHVALERGWIFQEMSFGELDADALKQLLAKLRVWPRGGSEEAAIAWAWLFKDVAALAARRDIGASLAVHFADSTAGPFSHWGVNYEGEGMSYYFNTFPKDAKNFTGSEEAARIICEASRSEAAALMQALIKSDAAESQRDSPHAVTMDVFEDMLAKQSPRYNVQRQAIRAHPEHGLTSMTWQEQVLSKASGFVNAYATLNFSYESDRIIGTTAAFLSLSGFEPELAAQERGEKLLFYAWKDHACLLGRGKQVCWITDVVVPSGKSAVGMQQIFRGRALRMSGTGTKARADIDKDWVSGPALKELEREVKWAVKHMNELVADTREGGFWDSHDLYYCHSRLAWASDRWGIVYIVAARNSPTRPLHLGLASHLKFIADIPSALEVQFYL